MCRSRHLLSLKTSYGSARQGGIILQKEFYGQSFVDITEESQYTMKLTYFLLIDNVREKYCDLKVYGAEIDRENIYPNGKRRRECKIIRDLFFKRTEAEDFVKCLYNNLVTPIGFKNVLSDYIDEKISLLSYESGT